jgi:hypothetical protein
MAECHPSYAQWYEQNNSTQKALRLAFEPTRETFLRFFGKRKYQSGPDGFSFGAWTGHVKLLFNPRPTQKVTMMGDCGVESKKSG